MNLIIKVFADYHTHTLYSHGKGSIKENIEAAISRGLKEVCISDHGPRSHGFKRLGVKEPEVLLEVKKKVEGYNRVYPEIEVLAGVEANIIDLEGNIDIPDYIIKELDLILVGLHLFIRPPDLEFFSNVICDNLVTEKLGFKREVIRRRNTEIIIKVLRKYNVDILTHPGYRVNINTRRLAKVAKAEGTALEINESHSYLSEEMVKVAAKEGVNFALGSDAHSPRDVGKVDKALALAKRVGLRANDIINVE
ncbi:PHP domain-containing protein [Halonatronum saccharophilum]|uniref:PHP domain-containing protein n=1 Tax=Halonatronum saccharophilum TaxID=150060 RepID=UPI001FDF8C1D|nr:PHP domain-containing protein [Halonatronum saccharophilum]